MSSKALEANIAESRVNVTVDPKYDVLKKVMEKYYGIRDGLQAFIVELCHPYKNWDFIVQEARSYALNYFHVLKDHPLGPEAAGLYFDTFFQAIESSDNEEVRINATDNLLLFVQRIIKDANADLPRFLPVLTHTFDQISTYPDETFFLFLKSFYQLSKIGQSYSRKVSEDADCKAINHLLIKYYLFTCDYWLKQTDPLIAFGRESGLLGRDKRLDGIFRPISHSQLEEYLKELENIAGADDGSRAGLDRLAQFPGYGQIVSCYSKIPNKIMREIGNNAQGNQWKCIFLLQIMNLSGLSSIHEETLRDINRTLAWLIRHQDIQAIQRSVEKTFTMLQMSKEKFPSTTLNCVLNVGRGVYHTDDSDLVDYFIDAVASLGFQAPEIKGVGNNWQIKVNPVHVQNIRVWLELIELHPKWSKKLLSSLIINLALSGVFIKDTDLFPRDITQLLNSDFSPVYNLVKQLTRLFPAYFNDIGAEGALRDLSTELDEICQRKDVLIHFLRKQSHVESSNRIIGLMEGTLMFWKTGNKESVRPFIPPDIYEQIETDGTYIDGVRRVVETLYDNSGIAHVTDLLNIETDILKSLTKNRPGISDVDIKRVAFAIDLYRLLYQKYHLDFTEMDSYLLHLQGSGLPDLEKLKKALNVKDPERRLKALLGYLDKLERVILSSMDYEIREDIYRKRHFTVDIPSMYGSYHEMKFDALGLAFRVESMVNVLFEEIMDAFNLSVITRATISKIHEHLRLFDWALRLDGIVSSEMAQQLDLLAHALEIRGFTATQYLDIIRGFSQAVSNIVNDYFNNMHHENLLKIIDKMPTERLLSKYIPQDRPVDRESLGYRVSEIFLRDRITSSLGLQQLDLFLARILSTLHRQLQELPRERLQMLLDSDPQKTVMPIYAPKKGMLDIIHLGNKGLNIVKMNSYGLPVPPGFIVTTDVFRCREIMDHYKPAKEALRKQISFEMAGLEKMTGKSFGNPGNPLLVSVRSGSSVSQPGMLSTFLDVGINEDIVRGMVALTDNMWFAWDTYRRFLQSYGMAYDIERDAFDAIIAGYKNQVGIPLKKDLSGRQMRELALKYKELILDMGIPIEESPIEQLYISIKKVLDSWHSPKAQTYRKIMGISEDWGTAVTIQSMAFGNFSSRSGSGVFFTHNPRWSGDMVLLWGDFTIGNQGEDVVSGLVRTLPISKRQAEIENRPIDKSLQVMFPDIYHAMREWAKELVYERKWSPQEMEFTFESPDPHNLYFLQTRDMNIRERRKAYAFDTEEDSPPILLEHGIGVSGGAMTGRVVFSLEEIRHWRKVETETHLIIVRSDTVPDDIKEIHEADGLLTARGGTTSHAAVVAHRLGKTCVVGCANLVCLEKDSQCSLYQYKMKTGDWISIDGLDGSVYLGRMKIKETEGD